MKTKNIFIAFAAILCGMMCLLTGCTRDNDITIPETSVHKMDAITVQSGETITLTGENMHLISKVYFGDAATISISTPQADRDHQSLTITVPATDVIEATTLVSLSVLYNSVHRIVVCDELTVYVEPDDSEFPSE